MTEYAFEGPKRASTTVSWSFATQTFYKDGSYPFSSAIAAQYQTTIQAAFAAWSAVSGLTFTQVADSASTGIRVGFGVFPSRSTVGETVIRSSNGALADDTVLRLVDPASYSLVPNSQGAWVYQQLDITLFQVAVHEIGHAIGLDHSSDPATIMYPVASTLNAQLATGDIEGANILYPLYTVATADSVQLEGNSGTTNYHFTITRHDDLSNPVTLSYAVVGQANGGLPGSVAATAGEFVGGVFPSGQVSFAPGVGSVVLTVSVAANTIPQADQGFTVSLSGTGSDTATVRGTTSAVILDDDSNINAVAGTIGIYRFFDNSNGSHFFTADAAERNSLLTTRSDLTYEGVQLSALASQNSDSNAAPVFRFFDTRYGTHFFTASAGERDTILQSRTDLSYEGVAFYEHAVQQGGDTAVYRFFDTESGTHFFTSSTAERNTILTTRADLRAEGVAFYAPATV